MLNLLNMKNGLIKIIGLVCIFTTLLFISCNTRTYMGRWMTWRASDIKDYEKFPSYMFTASPSPFRFNKASNPTIGKLLVPVRNGNKEPLVEVLQNSETTAFIVIRNDSLVYEVFFSGYDRESINTSFSVAKSITSLMIGKAIEDGLIKSINDPITQYLPEFIQLDSRYNQLKISYLLNMRSGIQFKDHDLPWGDKPKAYYHPRLRERLMQLPITFEPGSKFKYNSYNPIMAGMILERACHQSPAKYFENKFWDKLGMEFSGSWSMDSDESGMTKMESGLNIRAIDLAKFARLVLNNGNWNGDQLISDKWIKESTKVSPENNLKEFGVETHYSNFWWLYSKDEKQAYIISGSGHLGQYLYIFPDKKIIIVRMGKDTGKVDSWKKIFTEVADHLSL